MSAETSQGGIVLIDKPSGMTSHDVVARMRRRLGTKRVGHAGTLDPMATGLLVVLFGEGTKLEPYLSISDKAYEAVIAFGRSTDTLDREGQTIAEEAPSAELVRELCDLEADIERAAPLFQAALEQERARREQIPPAFSAIKVDGVRSHRLARKGELLDLPARNVHILELALRRASAAHAETLPSVALYLLVTKGYYVRSFARDLGAALGCSAHLAGLRRVAAGSFEIAQAAQLDCSEAELDARRMPIVDVAKRVMPWLALSADEQRDARHGKALVIEPGRLAAEAGSIALTNESGSQLVAIATLTVNADEHSGGQTKASLVVSRGFV